MLPIRNIVLRNCDRGGYNFKTAPISEETDE